MPDDYRFGERLFLPSAIAPYAPKAGDPATRPLWTYASDPSNVGLNYPLLRVEVPFEPLAAGPSGQLFAVDHGTLSDDLRRMLGWSEARAKEFVSEPLDLDKFALAIGAGLAPTTGDPRFAGQMAYAVCIQIYEVFRRALGRNPSWGPWALKPVQRNETPRLRIRPCAFNEANAYYDPRNGTLQFGYFEAEPTRSKYVLPGGLVVTSLSRDVIAHELTHAILDGMRSEFLRSTNIDVPAFHEAFADIIALFQHFMQRDIVEQAIAESKGDVNNDMLLELGRQFGEAINGATGGALRRALEEKRDEITLYSKCEPAEEHVRGSILVSAVFEAYVNVYKRHTEALFRVARAGRPRSNSDLSSELVTLLARSASKVAMRFMKICIRAIDYCPPLDIRFGSYLRALITADSDAVARDTYGYRDALIKAFRRRDIAITDVRDLSEESLRWRPPDLADAQIPRLAFSKLRFTDNGLNKPDREEVARRATHLAEFILGDPARLRAFGLRKPGGPYEQIVIESIRFAHRLGDDALPRNELVAEVTQTRRADGNEFVGGSTVIIGMDGGIRYLIRRRVDDIKRRHNEMRLFGQEGAKKIDFRSMHKGRIRAHTMKA